MLENPSQLASTRYSQPYSGIAFIDAQLDIDTLDTGQNSHRTTQSFFLRWTGQSFIHRFAYSLFHVLLSHFLKERINCRRFSSDALIGWFICSKLINDDWKLVQVNETFFIWRSATCGSHWKLASDWWSVRTNGSLSGRPSILSTWLPLFHSILICFYRLRSILSFCTSTTSFPTSTNFKIIWIVPKSY